MLGWTKSDHPEDGVSKHSWGLVVALHPNSDYLEDAAVVALEPNRVEKYGIDPQSGTVNAEIVVPLLLGQVRNEQSIIDKLPYLFTIIHAAPYLNCHLCQIVRLMGVHNIYFVNGRHGSSDGPAHSFPICSLEVLYFLNAAVAHGIYPRIDDLTAVSV